MLSDEATEVTRPRLNPFAFPSDLDFRFALLIVLVLSASIFLYDGIWFMLPGHSTWFTSTVQQCRAIPGSGLPSPSAFTSLDPNDPSYLRIGAYSQALNACIRPVNQAIAEWIVGGLLVLLFVALAIYWVLPVWTIRRSHLAVLETEDGPELQAELTRLSHEAGLSPVPTFLVEPLNPAVSGRAFGRLGRYHVSLAGGLVVTFYRDPTVFRAVIRHELAHLRNRDVDKTYFVVAIWWAFLATTVAPFLVSLPLNDPGWAFGLAWRGVVLALVVFLIRNATLRSREVYADLRASVWDGPAGALRRVVAALPSPAPEIWRFPWQLHPRPSERLRLIGETDGLFRANFWDAFGAGLVAAMAYESLEMLAFQIFGARNDATTPWLLATLVVAPLVVGVVGVGVWRQTFADLARGVPIADTGRLGVGLGLGAALGQILSLPSAAGPSLPNGLAGMAEMGIAQGLWDLWLIVGLVVFIRWLTAGAAAWLAALNGSPGSWRAMVGGLILGGYLLTWWYGQTVGTEGVVNSILAESPGGSGILLGVETFLGYWIGVLAQDPFMLLAATIFWSFPLIAGTRRSEAGNEPRTWAFLDPAADGPSWAGDTPRLDRTLATGLKLGLVYAVFLLVGHVLYRLALPETTRNQDDVIVVFYGIQVGLAVLMAAVAAGRAARRPHRLGVLHGMAAGVAVGVASAIAILALNVAFGGHDAPSFVWMTFSMVVNYSALVALPVAFICAQYGRKIWPMRSKSKLLPT